MAKDEKAKPTDYVVLERRPHSDEVSECWVVVNDLDADGEPVPYSSRSDEQAIKLATKLPEEGGETEYRDGTFKAVPVRSWKGGLSISNQTVKLPTFAPL